MPEHKYVYVVDGVRYWARQVVTPITIRLKKDGTEEWFETKHSVYTFEIIEPITS